MAHLRLGLVAAALAACESPVSPGEMRALAEAEARWAARGFPDYAIEMLHVCFCAPEVTQWARVEVVAGSVSRVVLLESGADMSAEQRSYFQTVEQVFGAIREANNHYGGLKDVIVEFDRTLGFPTEVNFVPEPDLVDGGGARYLRNAGPIP